jgi:hypothetical protein
MIKSFYQRQFYYLLRYDLLSELCSIHHCLLHFDVPNKETVTIRDSFFTFPNFAR